jgi:hypothetical protein
MWAMVWRSVAGFLLALWGTPALADIRADYVEVGGSRSLRVEVADNGDMRFTGEDGNYTLFRNGAVYEVHPGPETPIVVTSEVVAYRTREDFRTGRASTMVERGSEPEGPIVFMPGEVVTAAGNDGVRYGVSGNRRTPVILSTEPVLLPLGKAMASYFHAIDFMNADEGTDMGNLPALLADHAVLGFWEMRLVRVDFGPIDPARFRLPAAPLTLAAIKPRRESRRPRHVGQARSR